MKKTIALLILAAFAVPAFAADDDKKKDGDRKKKADPAKLFAKKDKDKDGFLTEAEFIAGVKKEDAAKKRFKKMDADSDGKVSKKEFGIEEKSD